MSTRSLRGPFALCLIVLAACQGPRPALPPTDPDAIPEVSATGVAIAASWTAREGFYVDALEAATGATRIGALLVLREPGPMPRVEARAVDAHGAASAWAPLETTFEEPDQRVQRLDLPFVAQRAELRIAADEVDRVAMITWSAVVPAPAFELDADVRREVGVASAPLRSEYAALGVRDRASWGARATRCTSRDPAKSRIAIHHTVTPSGGDIGARLRGIQAYHMDSNGWCDVGYHFLVSLDGTLWEGRDLDLLGTHVGGHNTGNAGISFIGCFHSSGCSDWTPFSPPEAMIQSAGRLAREIARLHGITITTDTLKGHRDHAGQTTSCPGDHLHSRLGDIRGLAGAPATPRFGAQWVSQSFPLARDPFPIAAGDVVSGVIELRNVGTETWTPGATFLGTTQPRDVASPIAGPDWVAPNRPATVDRSVAPGEVGRFAFSVRAPDVPGDYPQFFSVVQEGVAWFSDSGMGGPPDDQLQVRVTSTPAPDAGVSEMPDGGASERDGGTSATPDAGTVGPGGDAATSSGDAGVETRAGRESISGGCSVSSGAIAPVRASSATLALLALALLARRASRRRTRR